MPLDPEVAARRSASGSVGDRRGWLRSVRRVRCRSWWAATEEAARGSAIERQARHRDRWQPGIGKAIARQLAEEGVEVVIAARGREQLEATAAEITKVPQALSWHSPDSRPIHGGSHFRRSLLPRDLFAARSSVPPI
jgi:hypothetical protein